MRKIHPLIYLFLVVVFIIFLNSLWNAINIKRSVERITKDQFASLAGALKISLEGAYIGEYLFLDQVRERMRKEAQIFELLKRKNEIERFCPDVAGIWLIGKEGKIVFNYGKYPLPEWILERINFPPGVSEIFLHPTGERHLFAYIKKIKTGTLIILREEKKIEVFGDVFRFEKLLDILTSTGRLVYLALIDPNGKIVTWSSKKGASFPIETQPPRVGKNIVLKETGMGKVLEMRVPFKGKSGRTLTLIAGYSYKPVEVIVNSFLRNSILLGFIFILLFILSFVLTHQVRVKMEEKEREIAEVKKREEFFRDLSALASGIAHEIKNPLNSIKMSLEMLEEVDDKGKAHYMKLINEEIKRLSDIVTNFLNLGKPLEPVRRKFNLSLIVRELISFLDGEAREKNNRLLFDGPDEFYICADSDLIRTVLINLIKNAIEATKDGIIKISLRKTREGKLIIVEDTGRGIEGEELEQVFKPYYTKKEGGVGLGMAIAKKIIDAHGGRIWVESTPGIGTKVYILLKNETDDTCN